LSPSEPQDVGLKDTQGVALPINLFAVPDFDNQYGQLFVVDRVDNPVYTLPDAIFVLPR
jgi:hypothetical protein